MTDLPRRSRRDSVLIVVACSSSVQPSGSQPPASAASLATAGKTQRPGEPAAAGPAAFRPRRGR